LEASDLHYGNGCRMPSLYHLCSAQDWAHAQARGSYAAASLTEEGFIHFSWAHQWRRSLQRYYRGAEGMLRLTVDPALLTCPLRIENGFPHGYGELPLSAVTQVLPLPPLRDLRVALWSGLSPQAAQLRELQADLVVLPELGFQPWYPARREPVALDDALLVRQAELARTSSKAILGGGVVLSENGQRLNQACLFDREGQLRLRYAKLHLPQEEGFWEADHYAPGQEPPWVCDALGLPLGVQLCSDIQRPFGATFLQAQGVAAILVPRATESGTYSRWRPIFQAVARLCGCYVLSVNRPGPEGGVPLGGPSLVVDPSGEVVAESTDQALLVTLEVQRVTQAQADYPGYLSSPAPVYAAAWSQLASL
jgi:predicted amidohydrolase/uncharacterized protein (DUF952 family)